MVPFQNLMYFIQRFCSILRPDNFAAVSLEISFPFNKIPVKFFNNFSFYLGSPLPGKRQVFKLFLAFNNRGFIFPDIEINPLPVLKVKGLFFGFLLESS